MKIISKISLIAIILLVNRQLIYSQNNRDIYPTKGYFEISTPNITHASNVNGESGFSIVLSYPGFFSLYGQPSMYYTTSGQDSYFASVGEVYLMAGIVKRITSLKSIDQNLFFNLNLGTTGDEGLLGSIGVSYLNVLPNKNRIELITDVFVNPGLNGDMFISDKPYSQGVLFFCNYSNSVTDNLNLNVGLGISYIRLRYVYTPHSAIGTGYKIYQYEYVSKTLEKYYVENGIGVNPSWNSNVIFPFGISLSYHF
jgi:hypothetical protein